MRRPSATATCLPLHLVLVDLDPLRDRQGIERELEPDAAGGCLAPLGPQGIQALAAHLEVPVQRQPERTEPVLEVASWRSISRSIIATGISTRT